MPDSNTCIFTCLRERARSTLVGKHRPDAILSRLEHGPKYVSLSALKSALGSAGLIIGDEETDIILKRFSDNRRRIEWKRLFAALDVGPPSDFPDPDRAFLDCLPQPYRRIVDILDTQIVDRAWAQIIERHPELETSPTDEARVQADIILKRSCSPSTRIRDPHPLMMWPPMVDGVASKTATGEIDGSQRMGNSNEEASARETKDGTSCVIGIVEDAKNLGDALGAGDITAIEWDQSGQLLFTGGRDGSVCLRLAESLGDIVSQLSIFSEAIFAGFTRLSRPVGALEDQWGLPSSVRVAAVVTGSRIETLETQETEGEPTTGTKMSNEPVSGSPSARLPSRSRASVLEVTTSNISNCEGGKTVASSGTPSFFAVHFVDLPEQASFCALSPDGQRLAVALLDGRVVTWTLPLTSPPVPEKALVNPTVENLPGGGFDDSDERKAMSKDWRGKDHVTDDENASSEGAGGQISLPVHSVVPPTQLRAPEFCIPNLPSPQDREYKEALEEYTRRVESGEIQEGSFGERDGGEPCPSNTPPSTLAPTAEAYHLPRVDFIQAIERAGRDVELESRVIGGGGLMVWRENSNVWKLYRLPSCLTESDRSVSNSVPPSCTQRDSVAKDPSASSESAGPVGNGLGKSNNDDRAITPIFDASSLPSAEWILPSPVTACALCDVSGKERQRRDDDNAFVWTPVASQKFFPLVAIGTEDGGVYLGEALLGTRREGLSRHRARVTSLSFQRRRFLVSGSDDEMVHIHDIGASRNDQGAVVRCLHDARGSGILRVDCLQTAPLAFAEDSSGRIVAYDLVSARMLGVLSRDVPTAISTVPGDIFTDERIAKKCASVKSVVDTWACGMESVAIAMSTTNYADATGIERSLPAVHAGVLGLWTAADVVWGLCPSVRLVAGNEQPTLAGGEDADGRSVPDAGLPIPQSLRPTPPESQRAASSSRIDHVRHRIPRDSDLISGARFPPGGETSCSGGGGSREGSRAKTVNSTASRTINGATYKASGQNRSRLTKGNVAQVSAGVKVAAAPSNATALGGCEENLRIIREGEHLLGSRWVREAGSAERMKRYMEARKGDRAAREARLVQVTQNLLQML